MVAATVVLAALTLFWLVHERPPAEKSGRTAITRAVTTSVVAVGDKRHLAGTLISIGLQPDQVRAAMSALSPRLRTLNGPLTLETRLRQGATGTLDLEQLTLERDDGSGLRLSIRSDRHYALSDVSPDRSRRIRAFTVRLNIQGFYASAISAGVDDRLVSKIAAAFAYDFDFERDISPGDVFVAVTEDVTGEPNAHASEPVLLYVSLTTKHKAKAFYRFRPSPDAPFTWYDAAGRTAQKGLMRTPIDGARITSGFGMRVHPILGYARMHRGIDFGTPVGTPVYAAGDGTIAAIGPRNGYGNYLRIEHDSHLSTAYGHLSNYPSGMAVGVAVRQGEVVAFSGNTGESTGPHLHYEVLVDNDQIDPATYIADQGTALSADQMLAFQAERDRIDRLYGQAITVRSQIGANGAR